jgi:hypothetical protein
MNLTLFILGIISVHTLCLQTPFEIKKINTNSGEILICLINVKAYILHQKNSNIKCFKSKLAFWLFAILQYKSTVDANFF